MDDFFQSIDYIEAQLFTAQRVISSLPTSAKGTSSLHKRSATEMYKKLNDLGVSLINSGVNTTYLKDIEDVCNTLAPFKGGAFYSLDTPFLFGKGTLDDELVTGFEAKRFTQHVWKNTYTSIPEPHTTSDVITFYLQTENSQQWAFQNKEGIAPYLKKFGEELPLGIMWRAYSLHERNKEFNLSESAFSLLSEVTTQEALLAKEKPRFYTQRGEAVTLEKKNVERKIKKLLPIVSEYLNE